MIKVLQRIKKVFKTRWKRFLFWYFFICIWLMCGTGIPNMYYLIPIKSIAVFVAWGMTCDNGYFLGPSFYRNLTVNFIIGLILDLIVSVLIIIVCFILDIDATPFLSVNFLSSHNA
ncbi:hypothetical protein PIPA1_26990 [Pelosinus sp. IPA-1]|nr:hypothetical protein PIPA1_26990 [Pelosinus sp. IPA-1]